MVALKSHRGYRYVPRRSIHASRFYLLASLSVWLSSTVETELRLQVPHLLLGQDDFARRLANARTVAGYVKLKCDVGSFFVSGSVESLAGGCCALFVEDHKKRAVLRAVEFLILG